jgi:hypothetical protein
MWLRFDDNPESLPAENKVDEGPTPAGMSCDVYKVCCLDVQILWNHPNLTNDCHNKFKPGGSHPYLGTLAMNNHEGRAGDGSRFYHRMTSGFSEEEKRTFLLTNERYRRHCEIKQCATDTLSLGAPLRHKDYRGGFIPTGPKYKSGEPNPWPKLAVDSPSPHRASQRGSEDEFKPFDPWTTTRWGNYPAGVKPSASARPSTTGGGSQRQENRGQLFLDF